MVATGEQPGAQVPRDWVPVEHRWLGLDKRTKGPAIAVLVIVAVQLILLPTVNLLIDWDDEIQAGDVVRLGQRVTVVPPVGWQLEEGIRTSQSDAGGPRAHFLDGGVDAQLMLAPFPGSADELLDQVGRTDDLIYADAFNADSGSGTIRTDSGLVGSVRSYTSTNGDGLIAAFTTDLPAEGLGQGTGAIVVRVSGTKDQLDRHRDEIDAMLRSISIEDGS